ncbi:hypothetical protein [Bradyrhizobium sp.]|uniref:hypothetical protein n=1 Tax=Bradyrhizobium sp. TaxID=376 RepID=UPI001DCEAB0C|nr:hypothetical protein [Bradyrhizobium sp.]MBI5322737.1 hypothetical protein [Bradyrhizobium sp.]
MVQRVSTVAFEGIEARAVDVQVQIVPGLQAFAHVKRQCQKSFAGDMPATRWPFEVLRKILVDRGPAQEGRR